MKKQKSVKLQIMDLEERIAPSLMLSTPGCEKILALGGHSSFGIGHHHHDGYMHGEAPEVDDADDGETTGDSGGTGGTGGTVILL